MKLTDAQWQNVFDQIAHALAGYSATLTFYIFCPWDWMFYSFVSVLIWAAFKEFWYDPNYEDAALRGSDVLDFSFYIVGLAIGIGVCLLKHGSHI